MAFAYLLLISAVVISLQKKRRWTYLILAIDFILLVWIFLQHITIQLSLNL